MRIILFSFPTVFSLTPTKGGETDTMNLLSFGISRYRRESQGQAMMERGL